MSESRVSNTDFTPTDWTRDGAIVGYYANQGNRVSMLTVDNPSWLTVARQMEQDGWHVPKAVEDRLQSKDEAE